MAVTVRILVTFDRRAKDEVLQLGREAVEVLRKQPGFVKVQQMLAKDENEIMALLQWDSEDAFQACKRSPYWLAVMPAWSELQENFEINMISQFFTAVE